MKNLLALIAVAVALTLAPASGKAEECASEVQEERITEKLTPEDKYFIVEGEQLDLFIENSNKLYNIGWVRGQIAKVWVIQAEDKHANERFQTVHLFFIGTNGCIRFYQTTYSIVVTQLLDPEGAHRE